jgi:hypothetical protein
MQAAPEAAAVVDQAALVVLAVTVAIIKFLEQVLDKPDLWAVVVEQFSTLAPAAGAEELRELAILQLRLEEILAPQDRQDQAECLYYLGLDHYKRVNIPILQHIYEEFIWTQCFKPY